MFAITISTTPSTHTAGPGLTSHRAVESQARWYPPTWLLSMLDIAVPAALPGQSKATINPTITHHAHLRALSSDEIVRPSLCHAGLTNGLEVT